MTSLVVGAEGVVLVPRSKASFASYRPISEGLEMVLQLSKAPTGVVYLCCATEDREGAQYWTGVNGLPAVTVVTLEPQECRLSRSQAQWAMITRLRARGPVGLVLTASQSVFGRCRVAYLPVMLYARRGSLGELAEPPTWQDLQQGVRIRRDALAERAKEEASGAAVSSRPSDSV